MHYRKLRFLTHHFWDIPLGENVPTQETNPQHDILQKSFSTNKNTKETETKITQADSGIHRRISAQFYTLPLLNTLNITAEK